MPTSLNVPSGLIEFQRSQIVVAPLPIS